MRSRVLDTGVIIGEYGGYAVFEDVLDIGLLDVAGMPAIHDDANSISGNSPAFQFGATPLRQFKGGDSGVHTTKTSFARRRISSLASFTTSGRSTRMVS